MFSLWDTDPSESQFLDLSHYNYLLESESAFARPFAYNDLVLDKIDDLMLKTCSNGVVFGHWCSNKSDTSINKSDIQTTIDSSSSIESSTNIDVVKPGPFGVKLRNSLTEIVKRRDYSNSQCQTL